ncbi:MAG: hypothetical protein EHM13_13130, partial [Acidobacteria bacterium]
MGSPAHTRRKLVECPLPAAVTARWRCGALYILRQATVQCWTALTSRVHARYSRGLREARSRVATASLGRVETKRQLEREFAERAPMPTSAIERNDVVSTGIAGLDDVMTGGFTRKRLFLVEGVPGSGKTTLAMQYLMAAAKRGEPVLYVTLSETAEELRASAASHGWSLEGIDIRELAPTESALDPDEQVTMFHPSEIELASTTKLILADVERLKPACLVFDSLSELRLLAGTPLRYRRQILAMKQFFASRHCTVVLLDDLTATVNDLQMQSLAHGVISLEHLNSEYGPQRRRLRIAKYRGRPFRGGHHDYTIRTGGIEVFP